MIIVWIYPGLIFFHLSNILTDRSFLDINKDYSKSSG